jgi:hypothetical protein
MVPFRLFPFAGDTKPYECIHPPAVPEPATLSLLAINGVALLGRRRGCETKAALIGFKPFSDLPFLDRLFSDRPFQTVPGGGEFGSTGGAGGGWGGWA